MDVLQMLGQKWMFFLFELKKDAMSSLSFWKLQKHPCRNLLVNLWLNPVQ